MCVNPTPTLNRVPKDLVSVFLNTYRTREGRGNGLGGDNEKCQCGLADEEELLRDQMDVGDRRRERICHQREDPS